MTSIILAGHLMKQKEEIIHYLQDEGYRIGQRESIDQGIQEAREGRVDLVILPSCGSKELMELLSIYSPLLLLLSIEDRDSLLLHNFHDQVQVLFLPLVLEELSFRIGILKESMERGEEEEEEKEKKEKKDEKDEEKNHLMWRDLVHHLEDVVYSSSLHGHLLYLNPYARKEYGDAIESFITRRLGFLKNIIPETGYNRSEYTFLTEKGLRYLEEKTYLVKDQDGHPLRIDGLIYDISELKHTENALRQGESRMRSIITVIPDTLIRFNQEGLFKEIWAQELGRISFFPPHFEGKRVRDVMPEEVAHLFEVHINKALKKKELTSFTYKTRVPTERIFEVRVVGSSKDEVVAILRDVTDFRKAQDSLKRFRAALDSSLDMILLMDYDRGDLVDVNDTAFQKLGYSREEILSMDLTQIETTLLKKDLHYLFSSLQKGGSWRDQETFFYTKSGESFPVEISYKYLEISSKPFVIASARDIRGRIKLQKERDRLFNLSLDMMCILNGEGDFQQINPAWRSTMGWRQEDLLHRSLFDYLHPDHEKKTRQKFKQLSFGLPVKFLENRYQCRDGSYKWLSWSLFPVKDEDLIVSVVHDITRRREDQERLRNYTEKLETAKERLEVVQTRLKENLEKAGDLHQRFLPRSLPVVPGLSFASYYHPAERIGGDFFNITPLKEQILLYIADVSGHGLDGAILTIFMREAINNFLSSHRREDLLSPKDLLYHLSRKFRQEDFPWDYFISLYLFVLNLKDYSLTFSNAGLHIAPTLLSERGEVCPLILPGLPISRAIEPEAILYQEKSIAFSKGSTLFMTTDGLVEQFNGDISYGEERMLKVLREPYGSSPSELVEALNRDFMAFNGGRQGDDDISFLAMKRDGEG